MPTKLPSFFLLLFALLGISGAANAQKNAVAEFTPAHLFVASKNTNTAIEFDLAGNKIRDIGPLALGAAPRSVCFGADGLIYLLFAGSQQLIGLDANLIVRTTIDLSATAGSASSVAIGPNGNFYISSVENHAVYEIDPAGAAVRSFGTTISLPDGIAFAANGHIFVASKADNKIVEFTASGSRVREIVAPLLASPSGLAFSGDGKLYVCSNANDRVLIFDSGGALVHKFVTTGVAAPSGIQFGPDGKLYISGTQSNNIGVFDTEGNRIQEISAPHGFDAPMGLVFSPFRFEVKFSGTVSGSGIPAQNRKNSALLCIYPGSRLATLSFGDDANDPFDVASAFGRRNCVLYGFEGASADSPKKRMLYGLQTGAPIATEGDTSLVLDLRGKIGEFGEFRPLVVKGSFHKSTAAATYGAQVASAKNQN
ncbi:MAG: SMP-30/gluconolactonase/LRE family protein [Planctomycetota bacterium]